MDIRIYQPTDCQETAELFYQTVHTINAKDYTKEQVNVWATGEIDLEAWNESLMNNYTIVAAQDGVIIGFGDIDQTGCVDRLFVHKDYQGMGVASEICDQLEKRFYGRHVFTHASITAKPFFEKRGFSLVKEQEVEKSGIHLTNYVMEKYL